MLESPYAAPLALFVVGSILLMVGLLGGGLELTGGEVGIKVPRPSGRVGAFMASAVGIFLMGAAILLWIALLLAYHPPPGVEPRQPPTPTRPSDSPTVAPASPTPAPGRPSPTVVATRPPLPTATSGQPRETLVPTFIALPTFLPQRSGSDPVRMIGAGRWNFPLNVTSTTCGPPSAVGQYLAAAFDIEDTQPSGTFIPDGANVVVRDGVSGFVLYSGQLRWPNLRFRVTIPNGYRDVSLRFDQPTIAAARFDDHYPNGFGECVVTLQAGQ